MTRDDGLEGKVALITGGASGIGQALAVAYARGGADSVVNYFPGDDHDVQETVTAVEAAGARCVAIAADVGDQNDCNKMAQTAIDELGRLDIAVAAAGILRRNTLEQMSEQAWNDMLDVDLTGTMRTFRAAAAKMTQGGAMAATSSIAGGVYGWESHAHYAAAKSGIVGLCRSLAVELAPQRIRVNAVIPGMIESPQSLDGENSLGKEGLDAAGKIIPLGRVGNVDECARAIRFMTSDDATYITGQQIIVDGGLTVRWPSA